MGGPAQPPPPDTSDLEEALAGFYTILEEEPDNQDVLRLLARLHWDLARQYQDAAMQERAINSAFNHYLRLIELDPDNIELMTEVAGLANQVENNDLVQEIYGKARQAMERNPQDVDIISGTAVLAYTAGHYDEAIEIFERALQVDGNNLNALVHYGIFLMNHMVDFEGAIELFERALAQDMSESARDTLYTFIDHAHQILAQ
jgi:tetratricopeptide (TPR) repeat protein